MKYADWIDSFAPAKTAPPRRLMPFFGWALQGAWPVVGLASALSILAGVLEVMAALLLGWVIDAALATSPGTVFDDAGLLLLGTVLFFVVLRPVVLGLC